jgi:SAM-dependent methyltransferase
MTAHDDRLPAFAEACEAVLEDPSADHSIDTTLAPVAARSTPDGRDDRRARLVTARFPADVERVLELGCGVGGLLRRLDERYDAVGVDDRRAHLLFSAARGGPVVLGALTRPPVIPAFDGVCAVEDATGRTAALDLCVAAYGSLRPGGIAVVAAPTDPTVVAEPGVETYSGSRYLLERAVDVDDTEDRIIVDYRVTDRQTGDTAVVTEERAVAITTADGLTAALRTAGFEGIRVSDESDLPGLVVGRGVRPIETGE